ncbi:transposase, partial [Holdemanella sp. DFI.5.55]|nr:transposase [Holdemanella sp. DFI.5.55]
MYGSPKITVLLNKNDENVSQKHVYNLMHVMGIK